MSNKKIVAVLQARFSSSRLLGKVLMPVLGRPMLVQQLDRLARSKRIGSMVVATSDDASDDAVAEACRAANVEVFRGSLNDVLDRFYQAALRRDAGHVVRLTGDCPLIDPAVVDEVIDLYLAGDFDYASNCNPPTFPDGLDAEVFRFSVLEQAWKTATLNSEREHVTPYMRVPGRFRTGNLAHPEDLSALRWTVDGPDDFEFVREVFERLAPSRPDFGMNDVLELLRAEPGLQDLNRGHERNEGYKASLAVDEKPEVGS